MQSKCSHTPAFSPYNSHRMRYIKVTHLDGVYNGDFSLMLSSFLFVLWALTSQGVWKFASTWLVHKFPNTEMFETWCHYRCHKTPPYKVCQEWEDAVQFATGTTAFLLISPAQQGSGDDASTRLYMCCVTMSMGPVSKLACWHAQLAQSTNHKRGYRLLVLLKGISATRSCFLGWLWMLTGQSCPASVSSHLWKWWSKFAVDIW